MAMCPICASDAVLEDTSLATIKNGYTQHLCWLECTHCGWSSERLERSPTVWRQLEEIAEHQRG